MYFHATLINIIDREREREREREQKKWKEKYSR